jgi:hypothetical protein
MEQAALDILHELAFGGLRDEAEVRAYCRILRDLAQPYDGEHSQQTPTEKVAPVVCLHNVPIIAPSGALRSRV